MSLLFYLFTFVINLWHRKFVSHCRRHGSVCDDDKILIKSLYLKEYIANRLTDEFPEKSSTKRGVNKLLKNCGTPAQLTGDQTAADRAVGLPAPKKTLSFFFRSSRSLPLTSFCRLSGEATENNFSPVKKTKSVLYYGNF